MHLEEIIHPIDLQTFLLEYWGQRPLLIPNRDPRYFHSVLGPRDLETFLIQGRIRYPEVRLVKRGQKIPFEMLYHTGWLNSVRPVDENHARITAIYEAYHEGYSLVVRAEKVAPAIATLCRDIEEQLHHPVMSEVFSTPKGSQGSLLHTDQQDVFVLQISGTKNWKVFAPPASPSSIPLHEQVGEPLVDVSVQAGEMLYVPRGFPHEACTEPECSSLHISVGVYPLKWFDLAVQVLNLYAEKNHRLNDPLPVGFMSTDSTQIADKIKDVFQAIHDRDIWLAALNRTANDFCYSLRPLPDNQFLSLDELDVLDTENFFQRRSGMLSHLLVDQKSVTLSFPGNRVTLPLKTLPVLEVIVKLKLPFTIHDLPANLDGKSRLVLIKHLVKAGYLQLMEGPGPARLSETLEGNA